jgi:hypothetical protein
MLKNLSKFYIIKLLIFKGFCSPKCSNNSVDSIEKRKNTCKQKYGVDNPAKSKSIQEKSKQKCKQKYGVDNVMKNKVFEDFLKSNSQKQT